VVLLQNLAVAFDPTIALLALLASTRLAAILLILEIMVVF
jgi:hypothetical protein